MTYNSSSMFSHPSSDFLLWPFTSAPRVLCLVTLL